MKASPKLFQEIKIKSGVYFNPALNEIFVIRFAGHGITKNFETVPLSVIETKTAVKHGVAVFNGSEVYLGAI